MKKLIILSLTACSSLSLLAGGWAPFFDTQQAAADGGLSIKLAAQGGLCGRVVLKPKELSPETIKWILGQLGNPQVTIDGIFVQSVLWKIYLNTLLPEKTNDAQASADLYGPLVGPIEPAGLWQRYDWAGSNWQDHYKLSCFIKLKPVTGSNVTFQRVPCDWVVTISENEVKHNVGCVVGPAGPDASYSPLNMDKARFE